MELTRQRVNEGLASARSRGRSGGRPKVDQEKLTKALNLYDAKGFTLKEIKEMTGVSSRTLYRYLEKRKSKNEGR